MSERKVQRLIERLEGVGNVTLNGEELAVVRYDVEVLQDFIIVTDKSGTQQLPGMTSAQGALTVESGTLPSQGRAPFVLIMQDGREMDFIIHNRSGRKCSITRDGEFRDPAR